jgi:spermidine synthase
MKVKHFILDLTVFVCGALVMIYEIIGTRILSPFIGTSTYVWTSLIGVILAALSVGYWFGGRLADRKPDVRILATVIFFAGGAVSVTMLLKEIILSTISTTGLPLEIKSLLAAILLFVPASVLLGCVTPYAVRMRMASLEDSGTTVGRLFAFSTIGSIVGTFLAGFFLIPFVGSVRTLYIIAGSLFLLSLLLAPFAISRLKLSMIVVFVFGIIGTELNSTILRNSNNLHDIDTEYSRIQVFETIEPESKRRVRAMSIDPYFVQSAVFLDSDEPVLHYSRFYHLMRFLKPDFQRTLMIGGAGFTFPREYLSTYPQATIDVVEIDPRMTDIARNYFRLKDDPRLRIIHEDGRAFLNRAPATGYDVVLVDAFSSLFNVPYQLTTIEAVRHIDRVVGDNGVVLVNVGSAINGPASQFLHAEMKTYQSVFPYVQAFKVISDKPDDQLQNVILAACKSDCFDHEASDAQITDLLTHRYTEPIQLNLPLLTDDLAPVEYYGSIALNYSRR